MANISLKDIQFPGLNNVYNVPEVDSTLTQSGAAADAKKTGDELSDLKQDFNTLDESINDNLLTKINPVNILHGSWTNGYIINPQGVVTENSAYAYSDYFKVEAGRKIAAVTVQETASTRHIVDNSTAFYDSNKTFISRATGDIKTVPSGAVYARQNILTAYNNDNYKPMVEYTDEQGTIAPTYSAWFEPYTTLKANYGADFNNCKLCVFGDSLAANGNTGDNAWINAVGNMLGFKEVYNRGIGATRVSDTETRYAYVDEDGYAYLRASYTSQQTIEGYTEIDACMSSADRANTIPTDTDVLIILAGSNDPGNVSADNFETAYKTMLDNIYARVPNARILLGTLLYNHNWDANSDVVAVYNNFRNKIKSIGALYGFPVIDFRAEMQVNDNNWASIMDSDGVHYNTKQIGINRVAEIAIPHVLDIKIRI